VMMHVSFRVHTVAPVAFLVAPVHITMKSLILAQDERWRRA
jgi:hypothetical protein